MRCLLSVVCYLWSVVCIHHFPDKAFGKLNKSVDLNKNFYIRLLPNALLMSKLLLLFLTVLAFCVADAQINCDGNINESYWSLPLATSSGGPLPCSGSNLRLNALYAAANDTNIQIGVAGIVQNGHHILLFIDSKTGGMNDASFNRANAPDGLLQLPAGTVFDAGFSADYCLTISNNATTGTTSFHLFPLNGLVNASFLIGDITTGGAAAAMGCNIGAAPAATDFTKGYELSFPRTLLQYNPGTQANVRFMAMIISDDGALTNQFLSHADVSATACFGKGLNGNGVQFQNEAAINPVEFNPSGRCRLILSMQKLFRLGS